MATCALLATLASASAHAQSSYWAMVPESSIPITPVYPPIVFDDGFGPTVHFGVGIPTQYFRWRNRQWEALPTKGLPPDRLYSVGLTFLDDGDGPAFYTVFRTNGGGSKPYRWRNQQWAAMPLAYWQDDGSADYRPMVSADFGNGMHIYGKLPGRRICRWNGESWDVIGLTSGGDNDIDAMIAYDDGTGLALYVLGGFTAVNGVPAPQFARWDGQTWTGPWPDGVGSYWGSPLVATYDDGNGLKLYTTFSPAINGQNRRGLHRWDGKVWEFLGGPTHSLPEFHGMHVFDDGSGPGLYIVGSFANFGGVTANTMVRYDANGFHTVPGSPLWTFARGYGVIRDERGESLLIRGSHFSAPPAQTGHTGLLVGRRLPSCPADCDADGRVNVRDFACFINDYAGFSPYANTNLDSTFDVQDFAAYLNRFAAGCP